MPAYASESNVTKFEYEPNLRSGLILEKYVKSSIFNILIIRDLRRTFKQVSKIE